MRTEVDRTDPVVTVVDARQVKSGEEEAHSKSGITEILKRVRHFPVIWE